MTSWIFRFTIFTGILERNGRIYASTTIHKIIVSGRFFY